MSILQAPEYDPLQITVLEEPSCEPISADEVKEFARIDGDHEDTLIESIIVSVRVAAEEYLGRKLITQKLRAVMNYWHGDRLCLPYPPLQSIDQVFVRDEDDVETAYNSANYYAVKESIPGMLVIRDGCSYPGNTDRFTAGFGVDYTAGYGDAPENVPSPIRQALMFWAAAVYEDRATLSEPPKNVYQFFDLFKVETL